MFKYIQDIANFNIINKIFANFYPYIKEKLFISLVKKRQNKIDQELLGANIRYRAHAIEKNIYAIGKPRFNHWLPILQELLDIWDKEYKVQEPFIIWAKNLIKEHKEKFHK